MNNSKTKLFNSLHWNPGTLGVDAFSSNWQSDMNWLVPPVALAARAIMHLVKCKARGKLVVPKWPSSRFEPLIFDRNLEYKKYVSDVLEFSEHNRIFAPGQNVNSMFANGTFTGKILAVKLDASLC